MPSQWSHPFSSLSCKLWCCYPWPYGLWRLWSLDSKPRATRSQTRCSLEGSCVLSGSDRECPTGWLIHLRRDITDKDLVEDSLKRIGVNYSLWTIINEKGFFLKSKVKWVYYTEFITDATISNNLIPDWPDVNLKRQQNKIDQAA